LVEQGLGLSNSSAELLQEKLGEELTSEISNLLGKLTSGELVPSTLTKPSPPPPAVMVSINSRVSRQAGRASGNSSLFDDHSLSLLHVVV
jgi:hypothetical protein